MLALLVHGLGVRGGYVLDDGPAVLGHPAVNGTAPLIEVWTREWWGNPLASGIWSSSYRPLTTLTFAIEHRLVSAPWLHHAVNIVAFAMLSILVARLATRWMPASVAFVTGLGFALLPVHVENVASIVGRADTWAAMLAVLTVEVALDRRWGRATLLAPLLYLAALLAKESVALVPAILAWLIGLRMLQGRGARASSGVGAPWASLGPVATVSVVGIAYMGLRQQWLPVGLPETFNAADNVLHGVHGVARITGNLAVLGHYLGLVFVPLRLCVDHTYGDIVPPASLVAPGAAWAWLGLVAVAGLVLDGVRAVQGRSPGLFVACGLAYLLIGQWWIDLSVIVAERLALWPSVWLALALGAAVPAERIQVTRRLRVWLALGAALMAIRTIQRTVEWHDSISLFSSSVRACPAAVHGRLNLARALHREGEAEEAVWHFGVTAATRGFFPKPVPELPAFAVDFDTPIETRLSALPRWVGATHPDAFWSSLVTFLARQGYAREAAVADHWRRVGEAVP